MVRIFEINNFNKSHILYFQMVLVCKFCDTKFVLKRKFTLHAKKCKKSCVFCHKGFSCLYSLNRHSKLI